MLSHYCHYYIMDCLRAIAGIALYTQSQEQFSITNKQQEVSSQRFSIDTQGKLLGSYSYPFHNLRINTNHIFSPPKVIYKRLTTSKIIMTFNYKIAIARLAINWKAFTL